ncbi:MAG: glycosyltransferase [Desulfobacterales bacterium]|nr:glycosyltransferase [Desulfobacterales bacterium]
MAKKKQKKKGQRKKQKPGRKKANHDLKISACMMVKNEEEMLPQCLNSIKDFIDEIIVVDTGSTDSTVEIARSFGAKVYFHPWENDFSKHRNQSIGYATGDWFVIIDADEELHAPGFTKTSLKQLAGQVPENINALLFTVQDMKQKGNISHTFISPRLFRNDVGFYYEGIVHNNPEFTGDAMSVDIVINHYGYDLDEEHMDRKFERTSSLLLKRIDENPEDIAAYYYLCNLHGFRSDPNDGDASKTIEYGKKCLELLSHNKHLKVPCYDALYRTIGKAYANQKDLDNAMKWYRKGLEVLPDDPDLNFEVCAIGAATQDYQLILEGGLKYLEVADKFRISPHLARGRILYSLDRKYEKSAQYNVMNAYLGLRQIEKAEERWTLTKDTMMAEHSMQKEYLKNLGLVGCEELLLERTILFLKKNPYSVSLVQPVILYALKENTFHEVYHQLRTELEDPESFKALSIHIGALLVKNGYYKTVVDVLEPYYDPAAAESGLSRDLALAYDRCGLRDKAGQVYLDGIESGVADNEFLVDSLDFFKKIDNLAALESSASLILQKYSDFRDVPDGILLFLAEHFLKTAESDYFLDVSIALFERNDIRDSAGLRAVDEVANRYETIGGVYDKNGQRSFALQCLNVAWLLTKNAYYVARMGDVYSTIKEPAKAIEYYQLALNNNYLSTDMLQNMKTAFSSLDNQQGVEFCNRLEVKVVEQTI